MEGRGGGATSPAAEFEAALLPHLEGLFRLARSLMRGNRAEAEDLVQDAVLRAFQAYPRFQPGTNLRAWLFRILRNSYVDLLRRKGHQAELAHLDPVVAGQDPAVEEFRTRVARERAEADLESALAQLPAAHRLTLLLVDGEGLRYEEAAEIMECPIGTVRSRVHRSRHLLRQHLLRIWRARASS